jgi:centlein
VNSIKQARSLLEQHQKSRPPPSSIPSSQPYNLEALKRAQDKASDILNLSLSDIDDMLSISGDSTQKVLLLPWAWCIALNVHGLQESSSSSVSESQLTTQDKKWTRKWEKLLKINVS